MESRFGLDELGGDADPVVLALDGSFEHVIDAELGRDLPDVAVDALEAHDRARGDDLESAYAREPPVQGVGHPGTDVLLIARGTEIAKRQDGDGVLPNGARRAPRFPRRRRAGLPGAEQLRHGIVRADRDRGRREDRPTEDDRAEARRGWAAPARCRCVFRRDAARLFAPASGRGRPLRPQAPEVGRELVRVLVTQGRILRETFVDDPLELHRDPRPKPRHRLVRLVEDRVDDRLVVVPGEWAAAGEHLVEHDAERPDVGAPVDRFRSRLLRRHIGDRAERCSGLRDARAIEREREAEIHDLGPSARRDHDVGGLDVAVDHALLVGLLEARRDLERDFDRLVYLERPRGERFLEAPSLDERHRDERRALGLSDLMDGADIRVVESRRGAGLLDETGFRFRVALELGGKELQGDDAAEARILGLVDHAHAALADLVEDFVM